MKKSWFGFLFMAMVLSCTEEPIAVADQKTDPSTADNTNTDTSTNDPEEFDINSIKDTYAELAPFSNYMNWGPHNVHDPSIFKDGNTYYSYSTDVAYGSSIRPGLQIRKSKDLIEWKFVGWVFNSIPEKGAAYIRSKGAEPNNSLWAPYVLKYGDEYRLYYSLASNLGRVSVIGLAVSETPAGPWVERNIVVGTDRTNSAQTNGIDPTVLTTSDGVQYMYYGSAWDGLHMFDLNPENGLNANANNRGNRIAHRGFTNGHVNGNIEGPEIIYNEELGFYYLFIAYDWLETKYNIRVGRSTSPQGPFLDYFGNDINEKEDNAPMIVAPYRFDNHSGWQGVSHCAVFDDQQGNYFVAHQGRPGIDKYFMNLHVRKLFWTADGWPIASPERYAGVIQDQISEDELVGAFEFIDFDYKVVPGYANEQLSPNFQESTTIELLADGTVSGNELSSWNYADGILELTLNNLIYQLTVFRGRDWENSIASTILFSGLNPQTAYAVWGKKIINQ